VTVLPDIGPITELTRHFCHSCLKNAIGPEWLLRCQFPPASIQRLLSAGVPRGGFRCWGRGRRQRADCRHGPGEAFQQAPDTSSDCAPSSCTAGHCFYDVQSSARRSARGAGNHRLRSEFLPQDIRRNFAIPLLPPSCGSPIFSACREPRPQDSVCFAGRASRPPQPLTPLRSVPSSPGANNTRVRYSCACASSASSL
jgi:hypothetical protein